MSDIPTDWRGRLDIQEQIARIDRSIDEATKLRAEQHKLLAERDKFHRDPWVLLLTGFVTGFLAVLAAIVARLPELLHAMGVGP